MGKEAIFVYVVCGDDKYIQTLNTSLKYLKKFTEKRIFVITDLSRNKSEINHHDIIDVKTDDAFSDHQAAIYLKTSIHRYLDLKNKLYCYLDSDVLTISSAADTIFNQAFEIVGFCPDNITFDYFSPYAVNCECIDQCIHNKTILLKAIDEYSELYKRWKEDCNNSSGIDLQSKLDKIKRNKIGNIIPVINHTLQKVLPFVKQIHLLGYKKDKKTKEWFDKNGSRILYPIADFEVFVNHKTGFGYNHKLKSWCLKNQSYDVTKPRCTHLHDEIKKDFNINIIPENWQHPNGGVFLFDEKSTGFLERWHYLTLEIFQKNNWKTRDQGTLAIAFWEYGMCKKRLLPGEFNYIIDYFCTPVEYNPNRGFTKDNFKTYSHPIFIHLFHHFGDQNWAVWKNIESILLNTDEHTYR